MKNVNFTKTMPKRMSAIEGIISEMCAALDNGCDMMRAIKKYDKSLSIWALA